jgi:hypothetical protein
MNNKKGSLWVLLIIGIVILVGTKGYKYERSQKISIPTVMSSTTQATSATLALDTSTTEWKTYSNAKYGFSFKYPASWYIRDESDHLLFSKTPFIVNNQLNSSNQFAQFFVSDYNTNFSDKEVSNLPTVTPQKYFSEIHRNNEVATMDKGMVVSREWLNISNIPVFHHRYESAGDQYFYDNRYEVYSPTSLYVFVLYAGVASIPTTYVSTDDEILKQIISTFHVSGTSTTFINASSIGQDARPIGILLPTSGCSIAGKDTTYDLRTWLVDCKTTGTLGTILNNQGWKYCDHSSLSVYYWKQGVLTTYFPNGSATSYKLIQREATEEDTHTICSGVKI